MSKNNEIMYHYADSAAPGSELHGSFSNDDDAVNWAQSKYDNSMATHATLYCIENKKQCIVAEFEN